MMTIYKKEMRQSFKTLVIWTLSVAFMVLICIVMYPEMKSQMDSVNDMFANMGSFTAAFGMDKLNFGTLIGFYGIECGNMLGIGGGFFAALIGTGVLAGEEKEHTAEFLLTHPVSRASVLIQKLLAVFTQIFILNVFVAAVGFISAAAIDEKINTGDFFLLHTAYFLMQLQTACICFGISAFIKRGSTGVGLGIAMMLYFMNIVCNISEKADFLKYYTPYSYSDSGRVLSDGALDAGLVFAGATFAVIGVLLAFVKYTRKDISA